MNLLHQDDLDVDKGLDEVEQDLDHFFLDSDDDHSDYDYQHDERLQDYSANASDSDEEIQHPFSGTLPEDSVITTNGTRGNKNASPVTKHAPLMKTAKHKGKGGSPDEPQDVVEDEESASPEEEFFILPELHGANTFVVDNALQAALHYLDDYSWLKSEVDDETAMKMAAQHKPRSYGYAPMIFYIDAEDYETWLDQEAYDHFFWWNTICKCSNDEGPQDTTMLVTAALDTATLDTAASDATDQVCRIRNDV
ncbi:hypothetical protein BG006_004752 [Podila minutissima]|uniref:Uncharacterized protein n=1 Tax=Podila minutissima TaxID=64525 RepID=A0A9P5S7V3_9FUNG|nr:hypothetical protein BG006_004752 [Podila minutissima]